LTVRLYILSFSSSSAFLPSAATSFFNVYILYFGFFNYNGILEHSGAGKFIPPLQSDVFSLAHPF
jgi:hypothetical protein